MPLTKLDPRRRCADVACGGGLGEQLSRALLLLRPGSVGREEHREEGAHDVVAHGWFLEREKEKEKNKNRCSKATNRFLFLWKRCSISTKKELYFLLSLFLLIKKTNHFPCGYMYSREKRATTEKCEKRRFQSW